MALVFIVLGYLIFLFFGGKVLFFCLGKLDGKLDLRKFGVQVGNLSLYVDDFNFQCRNRRMTELDLAQTICKAKLQLVEFGFE
ncbi:hypothetical protein ES703_106105 [subsurface metagenome]